ncbi:MAG: glycosyltransferase family 2 protein [Paracoccaceae bacterium]
MELILHIGLPYCGAERLQQVLDDKRDQLAGKGLLYPRSPGRKNHTRLYMAATDPDHVEPLRFNRGYADPADQARLRKTLIRDLEREIEAAAPEKTILSAHQLATSLFRVSELEQLRAMLSPLADRITLIAHIDEQARMLAAHYTEQVWSGRTRALTHELGLAGEEDWWNSALEDWDEIDPALNQMPEVQAAPFWLDYEALQRHWEGVFGTGSLTFRPYDKALFNGENVTAEISDAFGLPRNIGKAAPARRTRPMPAPWLTRGRLLNADLARLLKTGRIVPRKLWRQLIAELAVDGPPLSPGSLHAVSDRFAAENARLIAAHPALSAGSLAPDAPQADWAEAGPQFGFRASQYLAAFLPRIERATREAKEADAVEANAEGLSPLAEKLLPPLAKANFEKLRGGPFAPHNRLGTVDEQERGAPYPELPPRALPAGRSGNVIVGCMKNEGPYILEWVAYHRAIGIDNFLIYTNGCEDGTSEILDRLQEMGVLQHRNNDQWKGNSPQQYALNRSLKEEVIRNADWIIHIDVDEFINVRCGNGTLFDFFDRVPDATNVAMTWRLFGHNGVRELSDELVIEQFDSCAPKFCPKPHTVWGFKTMFRNMGAYAKISCHRPNKLSDAFRDRVHWVNGSGQPLGDEVKDNGWRSSQRSIGYDLIQLNHYALRSAESFLIKRQRGRALHVDRSIGLNYWIRMDWSDHKDVTIQRNTPRTRAELARLLADDRLRTLHEGAMQWHRDKAASLRANPEFRELYEQALATRLTSTERVAYTLALDMES